MHGREYVNIPRRLTTSTEKYRGSVKTALTRAVVLFGGLQKGDQIDQLLQG